MSVVTSDGILTGVVRLLYESDASGMIWDGRKASGLGEAGMMVGTDESLLYGPAVDLPSSEPLFVWRGGGVDSRIVPLPEAIGVFYSTSDRLASFHP